MATDLAGNRQKSSVEHILTINASGITSRSNYLESVQPKLFAERAPHQSKKDAACLQTPDAGPCFDYVPRWFYNSQTGKCEQFSYGSCGGNSNNFLDRQICESRCKPGEFCPVIYGLKKIC